MPADVVVIGGGVGGLAAALAVSRAGHRVTVLERDPLPADADPEEAFVSERTGAPQAHQTHGFLARVVVELREHLPDVLDALIAAGGHTLDTTAALGEPQPGDEDLAVLVVRRTTFEWVLRNAALAEPHVSIRTDATATGLTVSPPAGRHRPSTASRSPTARRSRPMSSSRRWVGGARCRDGWPRTTSSSTRRSTRVA